MTAQALVAGVYRHARVAARAFGNVATTRADQGRRETAAIQEQEDLAVSSQVRVNSPQPLIH